MSYSLRPLYYLHRAQVSKDLHSLMIAVFLLEPHRTIQRLWCICNGAVSWGLCSTILGGKEDCLVLSREGELIMETILGDCVGTTIGVHSPIPY